MGFAEESDTVDYDNYGQGCRKPLTLGVDLKEHCFQQQTSNTPNKMGVRFQDVIVIARGPIRIPHL